MYLHVMVLIFAINKPYTSQLLNVTSAIFESRLSVRTVMVNSFDIINHHVYGLRHVALVRLWASWPGIPATRSDKH